MPVITAAQQKGGVGKSSVIINLACQAIARGKTAAIIDMDVEQGSATHWGERREKTGKGEPIVYPIRPASLPAKIAELKAASVQWVFIDLPGRDAPASSAGLKYSDLSLVPCRPVEDDIEPSIATVGLLRRGGRKYAYLMNIVQPQIDKGRARKVAEALQSAGHTVCPIAIVLRITVSDANARGLGVNEYHPESPSAREYSELFTWVESQLR